MKLCNERQAISRLWTSFTITRITKGALWCSMYKVEFRSQTGKGKRPEIEQGYL